MITSNSLQLHQKISFKVEPLFDISTPNAYEFNNKSEDLTGEDSEHHSEARDGESGSDGPVLEPDNTQHHTLYTLEFGLVPPGPSVNVKIRVRVV